MAVHTFSALMDESPIVLPSPPEPEPTPVSDPEAVYGITNLLGGNAEFDELALLFRHITKAGHTIFVKLWEATGSGIAEIKFNERLHEFVYGFEAQEATIDWAGNSLDENRRLFEIERIKI